MAERSTEYFEANSLDCNIKDSKTNGSSVPTYRCGLLGWRPACIQRAANIKAFLAAVCFISCLQASFSGYTASLVTTLEKRFAVGSSIIGIVNSFFEVGYILSVIFVSYAGSRGHVPAWISVGLFVMATGASLWSLTHFIFPYKVTDASVVLLDPICRLNRTTTQTDQSSTCSHHRSSGYSFLPLLFIAQFLIGSGSSPILTLTPPFVDDHVQASKAPPMIAAQYAAAAMGPVFGFALGASVLQYPADLFTSERLDPTDPTWIGAWWVGFIFLGILVLFGAVILLMFPRKLGCISVEQECGQTSTSVAQSNGVLLPSADSRLSVLQDLASSAPEAVEFDTAEPSTVRFSASRRSPWPRPCSQFNRSPYACAPHLRCRLFDSQDKFFSFTQSVASLIRNRIYLFLSLCICCEMFMIVGFASFLPKYMELEYQTSKSTASLIAGCLIVPAGAFGILVGGLILKRFHFHRRDAIRFVLVMNVIILGSITSFFFLGCENPPIAGVTADYPSVSNHGIVVRRVSFWSLAPVKPQLSDTCNMECTCNPNTWTPVCHSGSGVSFSSPCYAACLNGSSPLDAYGDCGCTKLLQGSVFTTSPPSSWVDQGLCPSKCGRLGYFIPVLTLCLFLTGVIQNPLIMVTMRSVDHQERSFALGVQFVIIRLLANLPSPMVFGRVIDEACILWRYECGRRGDCSFVDVRALNLYITSLGLVLKGGGFIFYIFLLYLLRSAPLSRTGDQFNHLIGFRKSSMSLTRHVSSNRPNPVVTPKE